MRVPQKPGTKGSLKWIQQTLHDPSSELNARISATLGLPPGAIDWRSPRSDDEHAEYRDARFLETLGLGGLKDDLAAFWPARGPQWDALGVAPGGKVILVEAKAHAGEMASDCAAGECTAARRRRSGTRPSRRATGRSDFRMGKRRAFTPCS
jgi:hypothetical protein